jgi:hypothetical protein
MSIDNNAITQKLSDLPGISEVTERIDARSFFRSWLRNLLIAGSALGLIIGLFIYLWSGMRVATAEYLTGGANFAGLLVTLLMIGALVYAGALSVKRAGQMDEASCPTVIDLGFHMIRLIIEITALYVLAYGIAAGLSMIIAGNEGGGAVMGATLREPAYVVGKIGSWIADADGWFLVRIAGLISLVMSIIYSFLTLLLGYMSYEFFLVIYRFFARKN